VNKNVSPVGWYVASYLVRFVELNSSDNNNPDSKFLAWENTVIVRADNLDAAYDKVVAIAMLDTKPYAGGPDAVPVQWLFEGVTELLPIYEDLEDGAEIMYREINPTKLKNLQKLIRQKGEFSQ
jgi:hypothetical protein